MARRAYVALVWPSGAAEAAAHAERIVRAMASCAPWRRSAVLDGLVVWTAGAELPVRLMPDACGVLVGDIHERPGARGLAALAGTRRCSAAAVATGLARDVWGAYVALLAPPQGRAQVFRDPSGQLGALTWPLPGGVSVVTSGLARTPPALQPRRLSLNWARIWRFAAAPAAAGGDPLFDGIAAVRPGELAPAGDPGPGRRTIWTPADFLPAGPEAPQGAAEELVRRVDGCVAALLQGHDRSVVELSGGLDSSIVAGAAAATGQAGRVAAWINFGSDRPEADEGPYAEAVAARLGVDLVRLPRRPERLTEADLSELAASDWPTVAAAEPARDRAELTLLRALGATALVSGEGGDAAFFQMPTALVLADAVRARGLAAALGRLPADLARRRRTSAWSVLRQALGRTAAAGLPGLTTGYVRPRPDAGDLVHPWVRDAVARDAPLGKRLQITALSALHLFQAESRRRAQADLLYPLFAQPVVEHCLAIPAPVLAGAAYDRPFARAAFADRLPDAVRWRRGKGDHSVYYGRMVALNLDLLRGYLLDGCLCEAGVLDRAALDRALTLERLIWGERPLAILWAAAVEAWVRHWQGRAPDSAAAPRA